MILLIAFVLGIFSWPALEYFLHRFFGHEWTLQTLFRREHQTHHRVRDFFAPAWMKAAAALLVLGSMLLLGWLCGFGAGVHFFVVGLLACYLFYERVHYSFHHFPPRTELGRKLRKHHFSHHFQNASRNFGVTTTAFDRLCKTFVDPGVVRVPSAFVMGWLIDESGKIKPEFAADYRLG